MNARQRALEIFCDEVDLYIEAAMEEGLTFDEALDDALSEYDEVWRVIYQNELQSEDLTAK